MADIVIQPRGPAGSNGLNFYTETRNPLPSDGRDNETWLNVRSFTMFKKVQGTWTSIASIAPPAPKPGTPGAPGKTIYSDEGEPSAQLGTSGDFFIRKSAGIGIAIYGPKAGAVWPPGVALTTVIVGFTPPLPIDGVDGQVWIDSVGLAFYGPKTNGAWGAAKSLVGPGGLKPIEPWQTGTAYVVGPPASFVSQGGSSYACIVAHTSGTFAADLAAGRWGLVAAKGQDGSGTGTVNPVGVPVAVGRIAVFQSTDGTQIGDGGALPTKATGANVRAGTDDAKYLTSKSVADAEAIPSSTGSGAWTPDLSGAISIQRIANGASSVGAPTNGIPGRTYALLLTQDATGSRTWSFNAALDFGSAGTPTPSTGANKTDIVFAYCITASLFRCSFSKAA